MSTANVTAATRGLPYVLRSPFLWAHPDLNQGPTGYEPVANGENLRPQGYMILDNRRV